MPQVASLSCRWQIQLDRLKAWFGAKHMCFDLRLSTALNALILALLDLFAQCQIFLALREAAFNNAGRLRVMWIYVFMLRLLRGTSRDREKGLPFVIWHLGMGAESWIFLHVGKWELHAETPGTNTPTQSKSGRLQLPKSWFHGWNCDSYQSVFQICLSVSW